jgi:acetyl-CoA acetyltransferase
VPGQLWEAGLDSYRRVVEQPAAHLWSRASIPPQDVDFIVVDDSFTFNALCWLEALGFCGQGEAAEFVAGGHRIGPDGVLPMNPHGGQLAAGRGNGFDNLYEAVLQLRGHAESRQIPSARVAVACSGDTESANAMLLLVER